MFEKVDLLKDLLFLYTIHHELCIACIFCLAIALPLVVNAFESNYIIFRNKYDGKPIIVHEKPLLIKTLATQSGHFYLGDEIGDPDFPQRRFITIVNKITWHIPTHAPAKVNFHLSVAKLVSAPQSRFTRYGLLYNQPLDTCTLN